MKDTVVLTGYPNDESVAYREAVLMVPYKEPG